MRILDLYIAIKITLIFTLLPYYLTENEDYADFKKKRSIDNMYKSAGELAVAFIKVNYSNIQ